jgi:type I restriction enzyme S subunit
VQTTSRLPDYLLEEGDIVFARKGGIERCALVRQKQAGWFLGSDGIRLRAPKSCDARFLAYSFQTKAIKDWLIQHSTGSTMASLNQATISRLPIDLPSLNEQSKVSDVLESFDNRIVLLRETNATLEAIAQALFKSWFVDFDPVRAKAEGRAPDGLTAEVGELFPRSFDASASELTPQGWERKSIYDVSKVVYGAPFASKQFNTEQHGLPLIRIRDLKDECPGVYTDEVHPKGYMTQPGDIVVGMDGEFRAYLWGGEPAWLNQRVCVFKPSNDVPAAFVHLSIKPLLAAVEASETATTVIHLGKNDINRFRVLIPSAAVLRAFAEIADPLYAKIVQSKQTIASLSSLRDTLLPRLISGRLRLPDAEELMRDAA